MWTLQAYSNCDEVDDQTDVIKISVPRGDYCRVVVVAEAAAAYAPHYAACAPCARANSRSRGVRAACAPLARTRAPPYLLSPSRLPARSTAHATHVQLQRAARLGTLRARNPNNVNVVWCLVRIM